MFGNSLEHYLADEKTRAAVERVLEVCGEAMNSLGEVAPALSTQSGLTHPAFCAAEYAWPIAHCVAPS